jgi:hypothetical protein
MARKYLFILMLILLSSCEKNKDVNENLLKFYGDALEDIGYSISKAGDGFVIAGQLTEVSRSDQNSIDTRTSRRKMGIIMTGDDGNVTWQKRFGGKLPAVGTKAIALDDGSIVCVGYVIDTVTLLRDIFIVKTDVGGSPLLQKVFKTAGDVANQYATDIIETSDGFLILGVSDAFRAPDIESAGNEAGKKDVYLMRINNSLELIDDPRSFGFPGNDEGVAIKKDIGSGYIVVATTDRSDAVQQDGNNILLLRVNSQGKDIEHRIIGKTGDEYAADIEVLSDGYLVAGTYGNAGPDQRGYIWRMPANIFAAPLTEGKIEIKSSASEAVSYRLNAVSRYKSNSFVMAGQSGSGSSARMLVFITDNEGNLIEGKSVITGGTGSQAVNDVISDDGGNIYAVGKNSYESNSMISLLKFRF